MNKPLVSVILPVYNVEEDIERCICSLRAQTLHDIEMIFVDDCGGDGSMELVAKHAAEDSRIVILRNDCNMGAGPSRNAGIEAARGEFLSFIDPDDYVMPDFLDLLHSAAAREGADIAKGAKALRSCKKDSVDAIEATTYSYKRINKGLDAGEPLFNLFTYEHTTAIFRKSLIDGSGARYGTSRNGQDTTFLLRVCFAAGSLVLEPRAVYVYVQRPDSAVHTFGEARLANELEAFTEKMDFVVENALHCSSSYDYVAMCIKWELKVHAQYSKSKHESFSADSFLHNLRCQAMRLPLHECLASKSVEISALLKDAVNIGFCSEDTNSEAENLRLDVESLDKQIDWLVDNPDEWHLFSQDVKKKLTATIKRYLEQSTITMPMGSIIQPIRTLARAHRPKTPDKPLVSVVIPVYKARADIERCVCSLRAQTLHDIEMIFVDDCGGDGSMELVAKHAAEDSRIVILRNDCNMGAGPSRNAGIEAARGEFLSFIDPDDYVMPDFLDLLHSAAAREGADIAKGARVKTDGITNEFETQDRLNAVIERGLERHRPIFNLFTYEHTTAIFRKSLIDGSGARYGTSRNGEDTNFLLRVCFAAGSLVLEPRAVYVYVQRPDSAVHTFGEARLANELEAFTEKMDFVVESLASDDESCLYIESNLRSILGVHALATSQSIRETSCQEFLEGIRLQVQRPASRNMLYRRSSLYRGLVDYGVNLCTKAQAAGAVTINCTAYSGIIRRWVTLFLEHPHCIRAYEADFKNALNQILPIQSTLRFESHTESAAFLKSILNELSKLNTELFSVLDDPAIAALFTYHVNLFAPLSNYDIQSKAEGSLFEVQLWISFLAQNPTPISVYAEATQEVVRKALRLHESMIRNGSPTSEIEDFFSKLRSIVLGLPDVEMLAKQSSDMRAFIECSENICPQGNSSNCRRQVEINIDTVQRWSRFFAQDTKKNQGYRGGLQNKIRLLNESITCALHHEKLL